jgi:hypothetical protein
MSYNQQQQPQLDARWLAVAIEVAKVNAMSASSEWLMIGGFSQDGKGVVQVWKLPVTEAFVTPGAS